VTEPRPLPDIELGDGHALRWAAWDPGLELNPQFRHLAASLPAEKFTALISHAAPDGTPCESAATLDTPVARASGMGGGALWQVVSAEPLTLSPSLLCRRCGDHGFIRESRWIRA
jgi:hypothetical protein